MADDRQELESDWIHSVFRVFREEVISIAADFGPQVKRRIDVLSDTAHLRPPSATALLTSVAIESTNMAVALVTGEPSEDDDAEDDDEDARPGAPAAAGPGAEPPSSPSKRDRVSPAPEEGDDEE